MKNTCYIILLFVVFGCINSNNQRNSNETIKEHKWLWDWISSWDHLSKSTFNLETAQLPEMVFFDSTYVYSNSRISIPNGIPFRGPKLYSQKIDWRKQQHNGKLILPDSTETNVQIMTFAAPKNNGAYFVMPAPSYWTSIGLKNETVPLKNMLNGIFVHEFAHTRQIDAIAFKIIGFEEKGKYKYPVNDDIVQNYFQSDSLYTVNFEAEVRALYELLEIKEESDLKLRTDQWLTRFRNRQKENFISISPDLATMEDLFLTMEGIGQYAMLKYYLTDKGGKYSDSLALKATRHNKKYWSQEEGLGLILLYEKLTGEINWSKLFSLRENTIIDLIEKEKEK